QQQVRIRDRLGKEFGVPFVREERQPGGRIDEIHGRSSSRGRAVSMPLAMPRYLRISRRGINSMRFRKGMTWTFSPTRRPRASRTCWGMTTWYLGEIVTAFIPYDDRSIDGSVKSGNEAFIRWEHSSCSRESPNFVRVFFGGWGQLDPFAPCPSRS